MRTIHRLHRAQVTSSRAVLVSLGALCLVAKAAPPVPVPPAGLEPAGTRGLVDQPEARDIPPLTELAVVEVGGQGDVELSWHTPLIEFLDETEAAGIHYEFRCSDEPLTNENWDQRDSFPVLGEPPPVAWLGFTGVELKLTVMSTCTNTNPAYFVYWDQVTCRASLVISANGPLCIGQGIPNQPITFSAINSAGTTVSLVTVYTDNHGDAVWKSPDLLDAPPTSERFLLKARWPGASITLSNGMVLNAADPQVEQEYYWLYDQYNGISYPTCSDGGGEFAVDLDGLPWWVCVLGGSVGGSGPMESLMTVEMQQAKSLPPLDTLPPDTEVLTWFNLLLNDADPPYEPVHPLKPLRISVMHEALLQRFPDAAESSYAAYHWDEMAATWVPIEHEPGDPATLPRQLDRDSHDFTFGAPDGGYYVIVAENDWDHDGLGFTEEAERGTVPTEADSDFDGIPDGDECWFTRGDPLDPHKLAGADQWYPGQMAGQGGQWYYVAGRIVSDRRCSDVSANALVFIP